MRACFGFDGCIVRVGAFLELTRVDMTSASYPCEPGSVDHQASFGIAQPTATIRYEIASLKAGCL
jgi:hypothetical protein